MAIVKAKQKEYHARIPNETARDKNLSLKAKGLLCVLLSMDEDWKIYKKQISEFSTDKYDATDSAFKELIENGYIIDKGRFRGPKGYLSENLYEVHAEKCVFESNKPNRDFPNQDNPNLDNPYLSKYTIITSNNSIPENQKKENQEVLNLNTEKISVGEQGSFFTDEIEVPQTVSDKPKTGIKKARASEKKSQAHPAVNLIKKYWFEEFRKTDKPTTPSQWGMRVSKITSIVNKIIAYSTDSFKHVPSEEEILDIFKQVTTACSQSNSTFYQTIDLSNLESKFAGALTLTQIKIENKNTGYGKYTSAAQRVEEGIKFFQNLKSTIGDNDRG